MSSGLDNLSVVGVGGVCVGGGGVEAPRESSWFACSEVKDFSRENK